MTKELLLKFLGNRCSRQELDEVIRWIDDGALSEGSKNHAFDDWKSFTEMGEQEEWDDRFSQILDRIHHTININNDARSEAGKKRIISVVFQWIGRVAVIFLIVVSTILIYRYSNPSVVSSRYTDRVADSVEVIAPSGVRTVVQLTDGTTVYLNSGSKIKYPRMFSHKIRTLTLSGEGYFEIAHDPQRPFIVKTKALDVKVLGTKFNVMSYPDDDIVATTLVEGKVVLETAAKDVNGGSLASLVPGQHVDYNVKTGALSSVKGNIEKYIAWKDGVLVFDNSSIGEVALILGRKFNVDIRVAAEIKDYTYTVKFVDESLPQILDLLTKATPMKYRIIPRKKLPDGTFSKQIILFEKRNN